MHQTEHSEPSQVREYTVSVGKEGYYSPAAVTAKVGAGMTETLSDLVLQTRNIALTVAWETYAVMVTYGSSTTIDLSFENIGRAGATFSFGTEGVPEGWSVSYRTGTGTTGQEISSMYLGTGDKREWGSNHTYSDTIILTEDI